MITLTSKQRRELRAQAHSLHPVVSVGQHGLTPQVMHEIDVALRAHGLVKVRVFAEDRDQRETMLARIAAGLDAAPVQHLGKVLIVWRPQEEQPAKPAHAASSKAKARKPAGKKRVSDERTSRSTPHAGRRARGSLREGEEAGEADSRRRRPVATKRPPRTADRRTSGQKQSTVAHRRAPSALDSAGPPKGKSAPNPRRRRRAG